MAQSTRLARDLTLAGGAGRIPKLVYGTAWKKDRTADLVYKALRAGFRGIDTAAQPKHYDEKGVAAGVKRAVADGLVRRESIFIQTKFTGLGGQNQNTPYDRNATLSDQVHQSVKSSLATFAIDGEQSYIDSLVLHSPMDTFAETLTVWKVLESYVPHQIRHIGISNTTLDIVQLLSQQGTVKPAVVQNRFHADTDYETQLRRYCRDQDIIFQSFWTITANRRLVQSQPVSLVSKAAGVSIVPAFYSLVMGLEGVTVLDGTTDEAHMKEDLEGLESVSAWADGKGSSDWAGALTAFKALVGDA